MEFPAGLLTFAVLNKYLAHLCNLPVMLESVGSPALRQSQTARKSFVARYSDTLPVTDHVNRLLTSHKHDS
jgi:hypothetical protein